MNLTDEFRVLELWIEINVCDPCRLFLGLLKDKSERPEKNFRPFSFI